MGDVLPLNEWKLRLELKALAEKARENIKRIEETRILIAETFDDDETEDGTRDGV